VRSALVSALAARAESALRSRLRRFLLGLSRDELQFIASYLGACILESSGESDEGGSRTTVFSVRGAEDRELKMILLLEYLYRSGIRDSAISLGLGARLG